MHNPVIRGFAPDPSMVRVGDWYYLATSSFEWFPTIPLHRSRDLAHWEYAGHVEGAVPGGSLAGVPDSGGVWAPSLSWDGERFWVTYSIVRSVGTPYFDVDTYISTSPILGFARTGAPPSEADGKWTAPRRIASHGFDPALFHEEDRLWLLNLQNDHRPGGRRFAGIVMTELDRETLSPVGGTHLLLQHERLVEGPKLVRRDGWYYLVLAEGGTGFEHGVLVARSRELTGPYELDDRPLLTSRDDPSLPLQKAGHGELVQTPDGDWVLSHLAARPVATPNGPRCTLGRETAIQAVTWDAEGWPRMRHGGPYPTIELDVPTPSDRSTPPNRSAADARLTADARPTADARSTPADRPATDARATPPDRSAADTRLTADARPTADARSTPADRPATDARATPPDRSSADTRSTAPDALTPTDRPTLTARSTPPDQPTPTDRPTPTDPPTPPAPPSSRPATPDDPLGWPWSSLRGAPDPSWADAAARGGRIRLRGRHGPESRWAHSLLAQRITEHRAEAQVTVEARPRTFTQAAGLVLWYNTEAYLALDLTWAEPEEEEQRGQQWRGAGRTVLSLVEREEFGTRQAAVVDVDAEGPLTLGATVDGSEARFWYVHGGARTPVGPPLDFSRLSDDYGSKLRFTGAMAGIHVVDLVDAAFTADFTGFRLTCGGA
nr:family 43 glycosylhydrolase [Streptomyces cupreus]